MSHTVKRIARGASTKVNSYAGPAGELVMDTTTNDLVLETGTAGGVRMAKASTAIAASNGITISAGGTLGQATTISGVNATVSAKGVVQLNNATNSTAQNQAATPKAVSDALQAAKDYADTAAGAAYTGAAPISVDASTHVISAADATVAAKGVVQLNNATNSTAQNQAATPKAVSDALQAAKDYTDTHGSSGKTYTGTAPIVVNNTSDTISVNNATSSAKGVVQVGTNISVSSGIISVASASISVAGVVQLSNSTSGTSQTQAATPKAVSDALTAAKSYADSVAGGAVTFKDSRSTTGTWTITGLTANKPLYLCIHSNSSGIFQFRATSGSDDAVAVNATYSYVMGYNPSSTYVTPPGTVIIPTSTSVTLDVKTVTTGVVCRAYQ